MDKRAALLFDLDGTLAETQGDLHAAMNHTLAQYGLEPIKGDSLRHMIGGGARMILQRGLAECAHTLDDAELDRATEEFVRWYEANIDATTYLFDGVEAILARAQEARIGLAVVTNKREGLAAKLLFRLGAHRYFDTLIGGDTLPERKPDPLPLATALARLGADADKSVMIGDSEADCAAAQTAGIACICVSFGYARDALNADIIIDHFDALPDALARLKPDIFDALKPQT